MPSQGTELAWQDLWIWKRRSGVGKHQLSLGGLCSRKIWVLEARQKAFGCILQILQDQHPV